MNEFFKKFSEIKEEEDKLRVMAGAGENYFIEKLTDKEKKEIIDVTKDYLKITQNLRFARKMSLMDEVLDPNDPEFSKLDARSLNFMLEKTFQDGSRLIELLEGV